MEKAVFAGHHGVYGSSIDFFKKEGHGLRTLSDV